MMIQYRFLNYFLQHWQANAGGYHIWGGDY